MTENRRRALWTADRAGFSTRLNTARIILRDGHPVKNVRCGISVGSQTSHRLYSSALLSQRTKFLESKVLPRTVEGKWPLSSSSGRGCSLINSASISDETTKLLMKSIEELMPRIGLSVGFTKECRWPRRCSQSPRQERSLLSSDISTEAGECSLSERGPKFPGGSDQQQRNPVAVIGWFIICHLSV